MENSMMFLQKMKHRITGTPTAGCAPQRTWSRTSDICIPSPHPASRWKGHRFRLVLKLTGTTWHLSFCIFKLCIYFRSFPRGSDCKDCLQCRRLRFDPWVGKILWRKEWQSLPVFLLGKLHGLAGTSWATVHGVTESDTTEWLTLTLFFRIPNIFSEFKFD